MELALELAPPEGEKSAQGRKARGKVELLPDIALQDHRMVRHAIQDFGGGQPVILDLQCNAHPVLHSLPEHNSMARTRVDPCGRNRNYFNSLALTKGNCCRPLDSTRGR